MSGNRQPAQSVAAGNMRCRRPDRALDVKEKRSAVRGKEGRGHGIGADCLGALDDIISSRRRSAPGPRHHDASAAAG
jgi:hypothetical protein